MQGLLMGLFRSRERIGLSSLVSLNMSHNLLSGSLPGAWGACTDLTSLDLSNNVITSVLPVGESSCASMARGCKSTH